MSISQINKLFQNRGCNVAVSAVLGLTIVLSLGYGFRGCNQEQPEGRANANAPDLKPIVTIGRVTITTAAVDAELNQEMGEMVSQLPADLRRTYEVKALAKLVADGEALMYANQLKLDISDDMVRSQTLKGITEKMKQSLGAKLKPDASDAEFKKAFADANPGHSTDEVLKEVNKQIDDLLKTDATKALMQSSLAFPLISEHEKAKFAPSDADLKAGFDGFKFKAISINDSSAGSQGAEKKADEVLAALRGGMTFEAAMDKYSNEAPQPGKKLHDNSLDFMRSDVSPASPLKVLLSLKPGELSHPIRLGSSVVIYKMISMASKLPPDFEKNKAQYRDKASQVLAGSSVAEAIKKLDVPENQKWMSEGWHVAYDYEKLTSSPEKPTVEAFSKLGDRAYAAMSDAVGGDMAAMVLYKVYLTALPNLSAQAVTSEMKIKALETYVNRFPEVQQKVELAEAYVDAKMKDKVFTAITDAIASNSAHIDGSGFSQWQSLNGSIDKANKAGLLTPDQLSQIEKSQSSWNTDYKDSMKRQAEQEAQMKKLQDEAQKQIDDAKKKNPPKAPVETPKAPSTSGKPK